MNIFRQAGWEQQGKRRHHLLLPQAGSDKPSELCTRDLYHSEPFSGRHHDHPFEAQLHHAQGQAAACGLHETQQQFAAFYAARWARQLKRSGANEWGVAEFFGVYLWGCGSCSFRATGTSWFVPVQVGIFQIIFSVFVIEPIWKMIWISFCQQKFLGIFLGGLVLFLLLISLIWIFLIVFQQFFWLKVLC